MKETSIIPIISLTQQHHDDEQLVAEQLRHACIEHGFFYIKDHGISSTIQAAALEQTKALFALPLNEKESLSDSEMSRGYTAMQEETLDLANQSQGDTKEGFYIGREIPKDHALYNPAKLRGPNQWPNPEILPRFRPVMDEYYKELCNLGFRMVQLLALSLHLPSKHFFDDAFRDDPVATLRLLHYDGSIPSDPDGGIFGCGAHSDYGMITILLTDDKPGLQILSKTQQWIDVPPVPDCFVVNLGDMLERWTNGLYQSTVHRVLTLPVAADADDEAVGDRYSIPFFYDPTFDTLVECLSTCCDENANPPKYKPITSGQHLIDKYRTTHADFVPS
ncbi:hypothetical protein ACA910_012674 [Epithemia clementina (nom. ined.)]